MVQGLRVLDSIKDGIIKPGRKLQSVHISLTSLPMVVWQVKKLMWKWTLYHLIISFFLAVSCNRVVGCQGWVVFFFPGTATVIPLSPCH